MASGIVESSNQGSGQQQGTGKRSKLVERLRLSGALAALDSEWRNVVLLIGIGGLTYEETATALHIPIGTVHRLANPGKIQLELIEVQVGSYLGEDDVVRVTDQYGRS